MEQIIAQLPVLAKIIPYVLVLNILLSAVSQALVILGKKVPALEKVSALLKKIVDAVSANQAH